MTGWAIFLRLEREFAIRDAIEAYRACGTMAGAAKLLGIHVRTLERYARDVPELGAALKGVRDEKAFNPVPGRVQRSRVR